MITKTIFEDNEGRIEEYGVESKLKSVKKITLRKINNIEIILINYKLNSEILIQSNTKENLETIKEKYLKLDKLFVDKFNEYLVKPFELNLYKFEKIQALIEKYVYLTQIPYVFKTESYHEVGNVNVWHDNNEYLNDYRTFFMPLKLKYNLIKENLEKIIFKTDIDKENILQDVLYYVQKPELYGGVVLHLEIRGKNSLEKADDLLKNLFNLTDKRFCIDASIEKIKAAWSG